VTGRLVRTLVNEQAAAGENGVTWQGRDDGGRRVSSGAYYVRLVTDGQVDHRKIMMLK
jgi:flagellar hook assembly protein FlgD